MKKLLAALAALLICSAAYGQAQLPAGNFWANDTASQRPARAASVTAIFDRALGSTRGSFPSRGASSWTLIVPGTSGKPLVSNGPGADPAYQTLGIVGGGTNCAAASGTCLDNITGFSSTGPMIRTGAGAYSFLSPTRAGDIIYYNGSIWTTLAGNNSGTNCLQENASGVPSFASCSGTTTLVVSSTPITGGGSGKVLADNGGTMVEYTPANGLEVSGTNLQLSAARRTAFTSSAVSIGAHSGGFGANGSGTYTTPANVLSIKVCMVGGGGGGGGSGSGAGSASNAGNTCWNTSGAACTSPVFQAGGGGGGAGNGSAGAVGGTIGGSSTAYIWAIGGSTGGGGSAAVSGVNGGIGGTGGASFYGGAGGGGAFNVAGGSAATNSGSGGGGAGLISTVSQNGGSGGSAGAGMCFEISGPAATYTYAVGAGTTGGTAGTSGQAGGTGAGGQIIIEEYYNLN